MMWLWLVWPGFYLAVGVVAPILFAHLDRTAAGDIAGALFAKANYVALIALVLQNRILWLQGRASGVLARMGVAAMALIALNQWLVTPAIEDLKHHTQNAWLSSWGLSFAAWHGVSSSIYVLVCVLGVIAAGKWAFEAA